MSVMYENPIEVSVLGQYNSLSSINLLNLKCETDIGYNVVFLWNYY
jgi:hypothetical protein